MNLTVDQLITLLDGHWCDWDGAFGNQCFDLAQFYNFAIGNPTPFSGATADQIYNQAGTFYTQIANSPDNSPQKGDLIIWDWPHVAIATGENTDANQFEAFEQNDPTNSNCHKKIYTSYQGVIGWLRPKELPQDAISVINSLRTARDTNWNLYQEEVTKNAQLSQNVSTLSGQVSDYKSKFETDESTIVSLKGQIADITAAIQKMAAEDKQYALETIEADHQKDVITLKYNDAIQLLGLDPTIATHDQVKAKIDSMNAPVEETTKQLTPILEQLWDAAVYKRVPKVTTFLQKIKQLLQEIFKK